MGTAFYLIVALVAMLLAVGAAAAAHRRRRLDEQAQALDAPSPEDRPDL